MSRLVFLGDYGDELVKAGFNLREMIKNHARKLQ